MDNDQFADTGGSGPSQFASFPQSWFIVSHSSKTFTQDKIVALFSFKIHTQTINCLFGIKKQPQGP